MWGHVCMHWQLILNLAVPAHLVRLSITVKCIWWANEQIKIQIISIQIFAFIYLAHVKKTLQFKPFSPCLHLYNISEHHQHVHFLSSFTWEILFSLCYKSFVLCCCLCFINHTIFWLVLVTACWL